MDVTERKTAEEALALSQPRLMIALAASRTGTYRVDAQTNTFLHLGNNLRDLLDLAPTETLASCEDFLGHVHPDDVAAVPGEIVLSRARRDFQPKDLTLLPDRAL